ncbi:MAG: class II aldolase/adducin family protein [Bacillota bacterium]|nr:class II aldolase/adducin family protein [Bacillota bacterium]
MSDALQIAKAQFVEAARRAYTRGIQTGNGGNISVRVPGENLMVVKPSGVSLIDCTAENLTVTDFDRNIVEGTRKPTRESVLHGELYKHLPTIGGIVHTHSPWAIAWSFTRRDLPLLTMHTQLKLGAPIPVRFFSSPQGVLLEEIPEVLNLFTAKPDLAAFILGAHGVVAVGPDVLEAEHTAELIEETAQVAFLYELGTKLQIIPAAGEGGTGHDR